MLHFARGRSPGKNAKSLGNWTFARVLPGAESPAKPLIANCLARGLAPGKCAPGIGPGSTPGKMCLHDCRLLQVCSKITSVIFKPCQEYCEGLTPGKMSTIFFKKKTFFNCLKNQNIKI